MLLAATSNCLCQALDSIVPYLSVTAAQDAGTIQQLPVYLHRGYTSDTQLEALHALYNMCKISPTRQEAAALAGVVPLLVKLAVSPAEDPPLPQPLPPGQFSGTELERSIAEDAVLVSSRAPQPLRPLAVSLLCGMAHSTHRTRAELWAHDVVTLLLDLLKEEVGADSIVADCFELSSTCSTLAAWQKMICEPYHLD